VVAPIWRGVTDFMDHKKILPVGTRERDIFEESVNTRENEVIDWIISRVMQMDISIKSK
jgi:hypothetical protein